MKLLKYSLETRVLQGEECDSHSCLQTSFGKKFFFVPVSIGKNSLNVGSQMEKSLRRSSTIGTNYNPYMATSIGKLPICTN